MILFGILLVLLAAICDAAMDVMSFKYNDSIFKDLNPFRWNPSFSWRNKFKYRSSQFRERFFGSTTIFAFLTDAWSMFKFIRFNATTYGIGIMIGGLTNVSLFNIILYVTIINLVNRFVYFFAMKKIFEDR